ncbi:MAG: flagellar hook-basal body complex protein FliE [Bdellovibrionaceae bacterium]|nr:flagellar hook-basal body complex protein FliE [Pseudobdellovibrionaceae bacterium]
MDGFTVKNASQFLNSGSYLDQKSLRVDNTGLDSSSSISKTKDLNGSVTGDSQVAGKSFSDTLNDAINSVNQLQKSSDKAAQDLATGKTDNVADVMIAAEKADIALRVMVQVRNKIVDAYSEIMKMQV